MSSGLWQGKKERKRNKKNEREEKAKKSDGFMARFEAKTEKKKTLRDHLCLYWKHTVYPLHAFPFMQGFVC